MKTAIVRAGGGLRGVCIEAGLDMALREFGIVGDAHFGTSAGAIVSVFAAARQLSDLMTALMTSDSSAFVRMNLGGWARLLVGKAPYTHAPAADVIRKVRFPRLEDFPVPVSLTVTPLCTMEPERIASGDTVDVVMASAASPLHFDPWPVDGRPCCDGGVFDNIPLDEIGREFDQIVVELPGYHAVPPPQEIGARIKRLMWIVERYRHHEYVREVERYEGPAQLIVLKPEIGFEVGFLELDKSLIREAYLYGLKILGQN